MKLTRAICTFALLLAAAPALADPPARPTPPPPPQAAKVTPEADTARVAPAFVKHLLDQLTEKERLIALLSAQLDVMREDLAAAKPKDDGTVKSAK